VFLKDEELHFIFVLTKSKNILFLSDGLTFKILVIRLISGGVKVRGDWVVLVYLLGLAVKPAQTDDVHRIREGIQKIPDYIITPPGQSRQFGIRRKLKATNDPSKVLGIPPW